MKMEIAITADVAGTVAQLLCEKGQTVTAGQILVAVQPH
jgi:urea carboxylase